MKAALHLRCLSIFLCLTSNLALGQNSASIKLSQEVVKAGTDFKMLVTLSPAPSFDGTLASYFQSDSGTQQIGTYTTFAANQATAEVTIRVPPDTLGGTYPLKVLDFGSGRRVALQAQPLSITVVPIAGLVLPAQANVLLSPTQLQFLETKRSNLAVLLNTLSTRLSRGSADTPDLRKTTIDLLSRAHQELIETRDQYSAALGTPEKSLPVFFEDFDAMYRARLIELSNSANSRLTVKREPPKYLMTQLQQRPRKADEIPMNLFGTLPSFVVASIDLITWNRNAYEIVETTGSSKFLLDLASTPSEANISYRRATKLKFLPYSEKTNLTNVPFDLAFWYFKFEINGCDEILIANPYVEKHPKLTAELNRCLRK